MSERMSTASYLAGRETLRRRELEWGVVRDAPAPRFEHQAVITVKLEWYARYGVHEGWLVDPVARTVEVVDLEAGRHDVFDEGTGRIRSRVLS